ncbi:unnamed protein product [Lepeophtheirus salmonis]|uniref:(salmon louse) hypothetical protein n=1 Tax=Lepeophtheirus salmonis TaxID=72036 RepID=A0A7R8CLB4_LEPSM|nr:unnamed protein product [Lepeophtheirus salmonis]CAF2855259.1 unnamed protein product [Lepeophtheirus salmonis]
MHLNLVSEFTSDIGQVAGVVYIAADARSRPSLHIVNNVDLDTLAKLQEEDEELETFLTFHVMLLKFVSQLYLSSYTIITCDVSMGTAHPFLSTENRRNVFESLQKLSHQGVSRTIIMVKGHFLWPVIKKDIRQ